MLQRTKEGPKGENIVKLNKRKLRSTTLLPNGVIMRGAEDTQHCIDMLNVKGEVKIY